jgi:hypothetical protein
MAHNVSEVDISNSCFRKIGVRQKIGSFDEGTPAANFAADRYEELRDELLRAHSWNFAMKRAALAQVATDPVFEYDRAYQLPSDWLRTVRVFDNDAGAGYIDYREEDGKILASREALWLLYVYEVTGPNAMTPDFREALAYKMAIEAAVDLVGSRNLSETMEVRFEKSFVKAMGTDAQSDGPRRLPRGTWVTRRFRGTQNVASSTS